MPRIFTDSKRDVIKHKAKGNKREIATDTN